ncbi:DUF3488 and transglutaminase-like domain-containing protein [Streptomyces sp. GC420]|uniref:transglutaminase TgpA family protein n=1 Tax=Streptomyces sp. GC420 TaxID=2697568 RepID=UPI001414CC86|nr:DUF3488 and transglutaminase-like domain-containing protein [Streptomyces sp. GC420]NBM18171.1 DUF4129 domain-containing protein [Streptomyces sp. GC420]
MSGHARLALCAYAATMFAACALLPLVEPTGWIVQAGFLLAILAGVGALARRVPLARPLTVLAQAVVGLLLLTTAFAREQAPAGLLPGPDVFREFGQLLAEGGDDVSRYAIPAPATDGIRLMLVGGVLVIGLAVDALAVTFRSAAPAGLPLLALYSVAAGLSDGASWLWFVLAAVGYLLLLLAEGRDRLSQWGRVFGGAPRGPLRSSAGLQSGRPALAPVRTGRRIGVMALGIALVVPAALPALDGGLLGGTGSGSGSGPGGGTISAVNPLVSLQNSLNQPEDREVLTYRTTSEQTQDMYLRIVSLDQFDGTAWKPSERRIEDVPTVFPQTPGLSADVRTSQVRTSISAADWYAQNWLPMPYPATRVDIDGRWRFEPVGRTLVGDSGQTTRGAEYTVSSLTVEPTAEQLAAAPDPDPSLRREYTDVPDSLPVDVRTTALKVTRGADDNYERAVKLQDWFAREGDFTYDTEVEAGSGTAAISRFLKQKQGFCVHFSFSMAAMARTLGIPARVAVGFTPGSARSDGTMSVGLRDAHAWPELYFEGVGWTRFEPTPTRGSTPDYTREEAPVGQPSAPTAPESSASAAPEAEASATPTDGCTPEMKRIDACPSAVQSGAGPTGNGTDWALIGWVGVAVLLILGLPLLPMLWRIRTRSGRLAETGPGDRTLAAWDELTDTAWDYGILPDESLTPRKAAARIVRIGHLDPVMAESVHRVAAAVEQVLYAPRPQPAAGLAQDVHHARVALGAGLSRTTRIRALFAPRSAVRVMWVLTDRWAGLSARVSAAMPSWPPALLRRRPNDG